MSAAAIRPLPYAVSDRLAVVYMRFFPRDFAFGTLCIRDYLMWKENNHAFEDPSLFRNLRMDIGGNESVPEQVQGSLVTAGFFSTLAVRPLIGRTFAPGEDLHVDLVVRPEAASALDMSSELLHGRPPPVRVYGTLTVKALWATLTLPFEVRRRP